MQYSFVLLLMMKLTTPPLNVYEKSVIAIIIILIIIGDIGAFVNVQWYENSYAVEDGFIEWLTVIPLLIASVTAILYLTRLSARRSWLFVVSVLVIALFSFFAAGEEISWGQRLFGIQSSEYFKEHNAQGETNLHNLVVDGEKVNKIIFSQLLSVLIGIYLVLLPLLYHRNAKVKQFIDWAGVPVPRLYQILLAAPCFLLTAICPSGKGPEMLEFGICFTFLLIVAFPFNRYVFQKKAGKRQHTATVK